MPSKNIWQRLKRAESFSGTSIFFLFSLLEASRLQGLRFQKLQGNFFFLLANLLNVNQKSDFIEEMRFNRITEEDEEDKMNK